MKINIFFPFDKYGGGGNQFLKALKKEFQEIGAYEDDPLLADIILFNSHHLIIDLFKLKYKHPEKKFIHRIDGPISLIRGQGIEVDKSIFIACDYLADGVVYQSKWSKIKNKQIGIKNKINEIEIINAPDPEIFFKNNSKTKNNVVKIIATSNSSNPSKGFDVYKFLDNNLDFSKYEMIFVGNSPVDFDNITKIDRVNSEELAGLLRGSDMFITASKKDPCSNSLIEALHCGLPAVVYNDGGHPEIIGEGGKVFNTNDEVIKVIESVSVNLDYYSSKIVVKNIKEVSLEYINFIKKVKESEVNNSLNFFNYISLSFVLKFLELKYRLISVINKYSKNVK
jgi:glycosyltransferase involved in cell wall biosynthesis